jgi:DNA-binding transcriptional MerR regulator
MTEAVAAVEIPKRALFKPAEVCDLANVQPYVLRSWEAEFPSLGVAKTEGGPRVYRRADVEQVLKIRHLLLVEGLTLAGARRKLEEETAPVAADAPEVIEELNRLAGTNARERLTTVKRTLQSLLDMLGDPPSEAAVRQAKTKRFAPAPVRQKTTPKRGGGAKRRRA